ncbi:MAG: PP2C family protein-serine/threonine phosphatase [Bryobacteraceae bacterium]
MKKPNRAARRFSSDEIEKARLVQARLLNRRAPDFPALAFAGYSLAARCVGGDFYDFLDLGPGRLGLVLGDVSGNGIAAALLMASIQATLRSQCLAGITDVARLLGTVDRLFAESTSDNEFASLFAADYSRDDHRLLYVNCGHPPPLVLRSDGAVDRLAATAPLVGIFDDWQCGVAETELSAGDTLLIFSDGASEALDGEGKEFGERRLASLLRHYRHRSVGELVKGIARCVCVFSNGHRRDDLTFVAARPV